ncbi:protein FAM50 homolog, partial [Temnothorax curvispinosus]|uniref:Protein FAM50 homolog n=1 Tax=Temnothorax curvispinosus TaxID=300111 RepID=A0A6J1PYQ2_9HYME
KEREKEQEKERALAAKQTEKNKQKRQIQALSFNLNEDEDEAEMSSDEDNAEKSPYKERDEEENKLRKELRQEWARKQNALKEEEIEIKFSYWDGSDHRRSVIMKKGECLSGLENVLQRCLEVLRPEFSELKTVIADQLMYVKENLISYITAPLYVLLQL